MEIKYIPLSKIVDKNSKREKIEIADLVLSIAKVGLLEPLVVRKHTNGRWRANSGSRRRAALKHLRKKGVDVRGITDWKIPCVVEEDDALDMDVSRLIHNTHTRLLPSEYGNAFIELLKTEQISVGLLASSVGMTVPKLRLMIEVAQAPDALRKKVDSGELSLTAFRRVRNKSNEVKKRVAETEGKVTVEKTKAIIREAEAESKGPVIPGIETDEQTTVQRLSDMHDFLCATLLDPLVGPREQYWLDKIEGLFDD